LKNDKVKVHLSMVKEMTPIEEFFAPNCDICGKALAPGQIVFNELGTSKYLCSLTCLIRGWDKLKAEQIKTLQIMKKRRVQSIG
jgi:hypothetical protein